MSQKFILMSTIVLQIFSFKASLTASTLKNKWFKDILVARENVESGCIYIILLCADSLLCQMSYDSYSIRYLGKINLINDNRLLDWRSCSLTSILYTAYDSPPSEKYIQITSMASTGASTVMHIYCICRSKCTRYRTLADYLQYHRSFLDRHGDNLQYQRSLLDRHADNLLYQRSLSEDIGRQLAVSEIINRVQWQTTCSI